MRTRRSTSWGSCKPPFGTPLNFGHPLVRGLYACYLFNEGAGGKCYDSCRTPNSIGGQPNNIATFDTNAASDTLWVPCKNGIGLSHNTAHTNNGLTTFSMRTGTTFTIECLAYPTSIASAYYGVMTNASAGGFWFKGNTSGLFLDYYYTRDHFNTTLLSANNWYHCVISVLNGSLTFYVNGIANGTSTGVPSIDLNGMLCDNKASGIEQWAGRMEYERLWVGRALTVNEVMQLYQAPYDMCAAPPRGFRAAATATGRVRIGSRHQNRTLEVSASGIPSVGSSMIRGARARYESSL